MVTIRNQLVPASVARTRTSPGTNPCLYITVHETANRSRGAGAQAHANLQSRGNARAASWHIQVDDREAIRSYRDTVRCWHGGDGSGHGNMSSIGIEICVNADGDYDQALRNAAGVVRQLREKHDIPRSRVVQHNHWSGKNCPTILRSRGTAAWHTFVASTDPSGVAGVTVPPPVPERTWLDMVSITEFNREASRHAENAVAQVTQNLLNALPDMIDERIRLRVESQNTALHNMTRREIAAALADIDLNLDPGEVAAKVATVLGPDLASAVAEALAEQPDRDAEQVADAVVDKIANRLKEN